MYLKYDRDGKCRSSMTSSEPSTRRSFTRTGSTNARRTVVEPAVGAAISAGGVHVSASGDSEQDRVVVGPSSTVTISDVVSAADDDDIADCIVQRRTNLRGAAPASPILLPTRNDGSDSQLNVKISR